MDARHPSAFWLAARALLAAAPALADDEEIKQPTKPESSVAPAWVT